MTTSSDRLYIDLETYSSVDIAKCGAFRYVDSDDFEVMLVAYSFGSDPVRVLDLMTGYDEAAWERVKRALLDAFVVKVAHNCAFERACLHKHLGAYLPPEQWEDTMVLAAMNGLPMSLDAAGAALEIGRQKIKEGVSLISYFCKPCRPTISNGHRVRNLPEHAPEKWARFVEYCQRDVEAEKDIYAALQVYKITDFERRVFACDARINERGILVDTELASAAVGIDERFRARAEAEVKSLTGLDNPNSVSQLKQWLQLRGLSVDALRKADVADLLASTQDPVARRVLTLRQQLGKTSVSKYDAMLRAACHDGRVRGVTQYYGAGRTGRWAGRLVQLQNLPQNHLDDIAAVRQIAKDGDLDTLELLYDSVPDTLSQLIRTAFVAKPGNTFLVADYSAIEARVVAYLAGEQWRQEVFANGGDIYCASASQMFHVPVEKHGQNAHLRQKGKIAELSLGYGGGVAALKAFGADKMGLSEAEMQDIVWQWRSASPKVTRFWGDAERAARSAVQTPGKTFSTPCDVKYLRDDKALRCKLPSGRVLTYWGAELVNNSIEFWAQNQTTRQWERCETWGGKLVENIVQAFARDCLAAAMLRLEDAGYAICFHVHDEIICEAPEGSSWRDMADIMGQPLDWAPGLLLRADGYSTPFYMKD